MDSVTRLRPIWERLAIEHEGTVLLDRRLDLYTSEELERLVRRVKACLKPMSGKWTTVKSLELRWIIEPYLAPGGRWFFNSPGFISSVLYADLDNPDATWQTLIPANDAPIQYSAMSYEHIVGTPTLTIHIAVAVGRSFLPSETSEPVHKRRTDVHEISVWRISPRFDGDGRIDGLQAERISHFRHSPKAKAVTFVRIQGERLIYTVDKPSCACTVVRWAEANNRIDYPRQLVYHSGCHVRCFLMSNLSPF